MSLDEAPVTARAAALRRAFDQSFAEPPRPGTEDTLALLTLRVGGDAYAVKLADITGLVAGRRVILLPTLAPEFLGIAGLRGSTVPVWSLAALLGYDTQRDTPRWLILAGEGGSPQALGLAFEHFDGHLNVSRASVSASPVGTPNGVARAHVGQSVRIADAQRGVLDISSIVDAVRRRIGLEHRQDTKNG